MLVMKLPKSTRIRHCPKTPLDSCLSVLLKLYNSCGYRILTGFCFKGIKKLRKFLNKRGRSFLIHTYVSFYQWEIPFENWNIQIFSVFKTGLLTFASWLYATYPTMLYCRPWFSFSDVLDAVVKTINKLKYQLFARKAQLGFFRGRRNMMFWLLLKLVRVAE